MHQQHQFFVQVLVNRLDGYTPLLQVPVPPENLPGVAAKAVKEKHYHVADTLLGDILHHLSVFFAVIFSTAGNISEGRHRVKMMGTAVVIEVGGLDFQGYVAFPGLPRGGYSEVADGGGGIYGGGHGSLDKSGCHDSSR